MPSTAGVLETGNPNEKCRKRETRRESRDAGEMLQTADWRGCQARCLEALRAGHRAHAPRLAAAKFQYPDPRSTARRLAAAKQQQTRLPLVRRDA